MTNNAHNNVKSGRNELILTFADLSAYLIKSDHPHAEVTFLCSALRVADRLIGHGVMDTPADERQVFARLEELSTAMANMSDGSYANLKSRIRKVFRLARSRVFNPRSRYPLTGEWGALQATLDTRTQRSTSRLCHFAALHGVLPRQMSDALIERFVAHLRDEAMIGNWLGTLRENIKAWNRLAASRDDLPLLMPPPVKRTPYWIAFEEWPEGLREEVTALLHRLANPNIFMGRKVRKLSPNTVQQYRHMIAILVSATVGDGVPLAHLTSLAVALHPDHVARALAFLAARGGGIVTATMMQMMIRVRVIAGMYNLPEEQREELEAISYNLEENAPPERKRRHMASKNRVLLDRIEHDKRFAALVFTLPDRLASEARAKKDKRPAPALMRTALAIHLLLTCSMRRENLVGLELGRSIKRIGQPPDHKWIIDLTPEEVKNEQELRHELEGPTVELLEEYLADWRSRLCAKPNSWLFPGPDGERIDPKTMAFAVQAQSRRVLGVAISPHQFRHISADSFLQVHPDKLDQISEHLGHRDRNTTRYYYARSKQKQASRAYRKHVLKLHDDATRYLVRHGRKRRHSGGSDEL